MPTNMIWVAAVLAAVAVADDDYKPEQIHLALAGQRSDGSASGMSVAWFTKKELKQPALQIGTSQTSLATVIGSAGAKYITSCGLGTECGFHYNIEALGLAPNTAYTYRVGDNSTSEWSDFNIFSASPNASSFKPFGVAVWGDMGWLGSKQRPSIIHVDGLVKNWTAVPTRAILEKLKNDNEIDMLWQVGDIAYADDAFDTDPVKFNYEEVYNGYMNWFQNISAKMPFMVSPGNHESECHAPTCVIDESRAKSLSNFSAFNTRWHMPSATSNGVLNMWYSFNYGPIHFVSVNSETDWPGAGEENKGDSGIYPAGHFGRDGEYLAWLEADLKKAAMPDERGVRPWVIAGGHRPFREIAGNGVQELFEKYNVDIYFAGHTHSYVRTLPVMNGTVEQQEDPNHYHASNGTTLIVSGGAGCDEMQDLLQASTPQHELNEDAAPFGSLQVATSRLSVGMFKVVNASALHWQLYSSHTGEVLDDLWLTK